MLVRSLSVYLAQCHYALLLCNKGVECNSTVAFDFFTTPHDVRRIGKSLIIHIVAAYNAFLLLDFQVRAAVQSPRRKKMKLREHEQSLWPVYHSQHRQTHGWATSWQNQQNDCAPSEDSDQPGHPPSLIRVFAVRMKIAWVLCYPLSASEDWSDWVDAQADLSLRWAHSHCVGFLLRWLSYYRHRLFFFPQV